ncbi:LysM peptidoglycan-binding domain-containing protein, partial [Melissococcus plutonius]
KVQAGDTLSSIAAKNHTNIQEVANKNQISNINMIYEGQQLQIKTADSAVATPKTMQATPIAQPAPSVTPTVQKQAPAQTSAPTSDSNSAKEWIAQRESSGSYNATNGKYIGRYQLDASYLKGDYSPANQEKVAENYVSERYGSWEQAKTFWMNNGWY